MTTGTFLQALDAHRRGQDAGRPRRRRRRGRAVAKPALARLRARAVQDRHAPAVERPHHRLRAAGASAGRRRAGPVLVPHRHDRPAPARLPYHLHQPRGARPDPGQPRTVPPCTRARSRARARVIARRSKTRSSGSPTARATRSSSSPKAEIPSSTTATASRPACRATSRRRSSR